MIGSYDSTQAARVLNGSKGQQEVEEYNALSCLVPSKRTCCHATQIVNASTLILNTKDKLQQVVRFSSFAASATFLAFHNNCLLS